MLLSSFFYVIACFNLQAPKKEIAQNPSYQDHFAQHPEYVADGFDFPVGPPNAKGYKDAQSFGENNHSGEDWNGKNGGDSDLGDPIYAIAHGWVSEAEDHGAESCGDDEQQKHTAADAVGVFRNHRAE